MTTVNSKKNKFTTYTIIRACLDQLTEYSDNEHICGKEASFSIDELEDYLAERFPEEYAVYLFRNTNPAITGDVNDL